MSRCIGSGPKAKEEEGPWKNISRNVGRLLLLPILPSYQQEKGGASLGLPFFLQIQGVKLKLTGEMWSQAHFSSGKNFTSILRYTGRFIFSTETYYQEKGGASLGLPTAYSTYRCCTEMDTKG